MTNWDGLLYFSYLCNLEFNLKKLFRDMKNKALFIAATMVLAIGSSAFVCAPTPKCEGDAFSVTDLGSTRRLAIIRALRSNNFVEVNKYVKLPFHVQYTVTPDGSYDLNTKKDVEDELRGVNSITIRQKMASYTLNNWERNEEDGRYYMTMQENYRLVTDKDGMIVGLELPY